MVQRDSFGWKKNGSFNGIMQLFQEKKVQMLYHGTNMRIERMPYVEFAGDLFTPRYTIEIGIDTIIFLSFKFLTFKNTNDISSATFILRSKYFRFTS